MGRVVKWTFYVFAALFLLRLAFFGILMGLTALGF